MKISILTLFPGMFEAFLSESIIKRAQEKGIVEFEIINLRDFAVDSYGTVDDRPYGGGAGMVMRVDIVARALEKSGGKTPESKQKVVLTSPRGRRFNQSIASEYAKNLKHLVIICGHYEGFDERVSKMVDEEISLGDFVMTGGEIAAAAMCDSIIRLLPDVIKKDSPSEESFFEVEVQKLEKIVEDELLERLKRKEIKSVRLLEYPQYTRPETFNGISVPDVLLSGNHKEIETWRLQKAFALTKQKRPDLLSGD